MSIDVKSAVRSAQKYFNSLQEFISNQIQNIRLEEVEFFEENKTWKVTLSF